MGIAHDTRTDCDTAPPRLSITAGRLWKGRAILLVTTDAIAIIATFLAAYYLRFHAGLSATGARSVAMPELELYVGGACLLAGIWTFLIWREGAYENSLLTVSAPVMRLTPLLIAGIQALIVLMALSFLVRQLLLSRQVYVTGWLGAIVLMAVIRRLIRMWDAHLERRGIVIQHIVMIGPASQAADFQGRLRAAGMPLNITGILTWNGATHDPVDERFPWLGDANSIRDVYASQPFHTVILVYERPLDEEQDETLMELVNFCEEKDLELYMIPRTLDIAVSHEETGSFFGVPMFHLRDASVHPVYAVVKRVMDVTISTLLLLFGLPIWLLLALAIKLTSQGPVLFKQTRAGLHGKPFIIYKFRSMQWDAEHRLPEMVDLDGLEEPVFKLSHDPRVTRLGRVLRRTSLDEIPQLINVLKGEMSLVGPRPEELRIVDRYNQWQRRRLKAKPGLTGLQQVMNRGELSLANRIKQDLIYCKQQSLALDLAILARTIWVVARGSGAR